MTDLPVRYTIERIGADQTARRFIAVTDDGDVGWTDKFTGANHFSSRRRAIDFVIHRMGAAAETACVVRHTVH